MAGALEGAEFFTGGHAGLLKRMPDRIGRIDADITGLSGVTGDLLAPYEEQLQQAGSVPGRGRRAGARDVPAGTGADMSRFPAPAHLPSWAGRTPLDHQSGKRAGRARREHGNRYTGAVTGQTSAPAGRTQTREGARCRPISRRAGPSKARVAPGNTQMRACHVLLSSPGMRYHDPGPDYYDQQRNTARQVSHHAGQLSSPGCEVTLCRLPQPDRPGEDTQAAQPSPQTQPAAQTAAGCCPLPPKAGFFGSAPWQPKCQTFRVSDLARQNGRSEPTPDGCHRKEIGHARLKWLVFHR